MPDLFFACLSLGVFIVLLGITCVIWRFRWGAALKRFRYSLTTLIAVTSAFAVALGINRLQEHSNSLLSTPFPVTLLFCFLFLGLFALVISEARSMRRGNPFQPSTLDSYRSRQADCDEPISLPTSDATPAGSEPPRQKARGKWWLRRMPNRFRSISHRDFQDTPTSGYNNKND
jgi:hypothetical protein